MRYRQIDLNLFLVFDMLLRTGSVSRSAALLGVSQSAVSQALAKLREHFRDELFLKTSTGVAPTSTALSLAADVRQFVAFSEAAMINRAGFDPLASRRDIRIGMTDMGEISMVPRMIEAFRKDAPNCRLIFLDLWGEELREGFERGEVDLAINARSAPVGDILQQKLYEHGYVLLTHRDNPIDSDVSAADLATISHLMVSPGRLDHVGSDDAVMFAGVRRNVIVHVSNWLAVPHILESQRDLVAFAPEYLALAYGRFNLKAVRPKFALPKITAFQFWHRKVNADPFNLWLRGRVRELFAQGIQYGAAADGSRHTA
jgi:DNA-binding transcriptional LysR family regulator